MFFPTVGNRQRWPGHRRGSDRARVLCKAAVLEKKPGSSLFFLRTLCICISPQFLAYIVSLAISKEEGVNSTDTYCFHIDI